MKTFNVLIVIAMVILGTTVVACSSDDALDYSVAESQDSVAPLDFTATMTEEQKANMEIYGEMFAPEQHRDAWSYASQRPLPSCYGWFDEPIGTSRAVGVNGNGGQFWTMVRVKTGKLKFAVTAALENAVCAIEDATNVRFYNSQWDDEYYIAGSIKIKLPNVKIDIQGSNNPEGSGSFGLVGGEQYIYIPEKYNKDELTSAEDKELTAYIIHGLCNAAGMFNEQMRKDRDSYVTVNLNNVDSKSKFCFTKQSSNYTMMGDFDWHSITLASSTSYSVDGQSFTILRKDSGGQIAKNYELSEKDIAFLNEHYLPLIARDDNYYELDTKVYYNGRILTDEERIQLQTNINTQRGLTGTPPIDKRKPNDLHW